MRMLDGEFIYCDKSETIALKSEEITLNYISLFVSRLKIYKDQLYI